MLSNKEKKTSRFIKVLQVLSETEMIINIVLFYSSALKWQDLMQIWKYISH